MEHLTTAQIKEQVHAAIRAGDEGKKARLIAEINRRVAAKGGTPITQATQDPAKRAEFALRIANIKRGEV